VMIGWGWVGGEGVRTVDLVLVFMLLFRVCSLRRSSFFGVDESLINVSESVCVSKNQIFFPSSLGLLGVHVC
jgi:hypothetical protein